MTDPLMRARAGALRAPRRLHRGVHEPAVISRPGCHVGGEQAGDGPQIRLGFQVEDQVSGAPADVGADAARLQAAHELLPEFLLAHRIGRAALGESGTPLDLAAVLQAHPDDARHVVVSGGVGFRVHLAAQLGGLADMRIVPFRGEYYELRPAARHRVKGMVYPVPDPRYPFLGVHLTRDVDDGVHVGPNAVLALALEGYRWRDIVLRDLRDIGSWPGTWRLVGRHGRNGLAEMTGSLVKRRYLANVRAYLPDMQLGDLVRSTAGVRAQAAAW